MTATDFTDEPKGIGIGDTLPSSDQINDRELKSRISNLIDRFTDYEECEEYHVHDGTGEHEGVTPLPHDFDDEDFKSALLNLIRETRIDELERLSHTKWSDIAYDIGGYIKARLAELRKG